VSLPLEIEQMALESTKVIFSMAETMEDSTAFESYTMNYGNTSGMNIV